MPSQVKHFMKQIKRLKSSLQRRGSVRVYKMAAEQTVNSKCMFYFAILHNMSINSLHLCLRLLCRLLYVYCCIAANS